MYITERSHMLVKLNATIPDLFTRCTGIVHIPWVSYELNESVYDMIEIYWTPHIDNAENTKEVSIDDNVNVFDIELGIDKEKKYLQHHSG